MKLWNIAWVQEWSGRSRCFCVALFLSPSSLFLFSKTFSCVLSCRVTSCVQLWSRMFLMRVGWWRRKYLDRLLALFHSKLKKRYVECSFIHQFNWTFRKIHFFSLYFSLSLSPSSPSLSSLCVSLPFPLSLSFLFPCLTFSLSSPIIVFLSVGHQTSKWYKVWPVCVCLVRKLWKDS